MPFHAHFLLVAVLEVYACIKRLILFYIDVGQEIWWLDGGRKCLFMQCTTVTDSS